ncbi:MAG TPA: acyl-CoA dehydrogenase family protein, partial [Myxococcota bacterium]
MHDRLFTDELRAFQTAVRRFVQAEIVPHYARWEDAGVVDRAVFAKAGALGILCPGQADAFGGAGLDFSYSAVVAEELSRAFVSGVFFTLHSDIVAPYIEHHGSDEQRRRWLPGMAAGTTIGAIAMTEPGAGSDLQAMRTTAVLDDDGSHFVLNGTKTFISNATLCDLCIVAARTETDGSASRQISLIVVEKGTPGFAVGQPFDKLGLHAQDTAELSFTDCRVPVGNLLGHRGRGLQALMQELARERLVVAVGCVASARAALELTTSYVKDRQVFGKPLAQQQNTRFTIAEMAMQVNVAEAFVDRCIEELAGGTLTTETASMAKWHSSEMLGRVVDDGLQLFGGYG